MKPTGRYLRRLGVINPVTGTEPYCCHKFALVFLVTLVVALQKVIQIGLFAGGCISYNRAVFFSQTGSNIA
jgi:hypothetical protein